MIIRILTLTLILFSSNYFLILAQNKQATIDSLNAAVKACIQKHAPTSQVLDSSFIFYDWAKEFQGYCGEVLYDQNSEVLTEIADQQETVTALLGLKNACEVIGQFEKDLSQIDKILNKKLQEKSYEGTDRQLNYQEGRTVSFTVGDTRKLKVFVNSIVNRIEGDHSILRIFR
ncbi:MAG: hypothetical protein NW226_22485 [Microscillaceae bacterium]|nr:hypothetical protein [Microscillaceae bacterium]